MASLIVSLTFLSAGINLVLAAYGAWRYRQRRDPVVLASVAMMTALAAWALVDAFSLTARTVGDKVVWFQFVEIAAGTGVLGWIAFVFTYTGADEWIAPRRFALLASGPLVYNLLVVPTHGFGHDLMLASVDGLRSPPGTAVVLLQAEFGWGYYVNFAWLIALSLTGVYLIARMLVRFRRIHRGQAAALSLGAFAPVVGAVVFHLGISGWFDSTSILFSVSGVAFGVAVFHYRLLDLTPVGRDSVVERMDDGYLVVNDRDRVVDFNPSAERILGDSVTVGAAADEVLPGGFSLPDAVDTAARPVDELTLTVDDEERVFEADVVPLSDEGRSVGRAITLRDVTDHRRREQLEVVNRFLRHNIGNDISVVQGYAEVIADRADDESIVGNAELVMGAADRIARRSTKARDVQRLLDVTGDRRRFTYDLGSLLPERVERLREEYPDARITVETPDSLSVEAVEDLSIALDELLENAAMHVEDPTVEVTARRVDGETAEVVVADDGPGIPEDEIEVIEKGQETDLLHGSGFGLWIVSWVIEASDGEVTFETPEGGGTVVRVALSIAG